MFQRLVRLEERFVCLVILTKWLLKLQLLIVLLFLIWQIIHWTKYVVSRWINHSVVSHWAYHCRFWLNKSLSRFSFDKLFLLFLTGHYNVTTKLTNFNFFLSTVPLFNSFICCKISYLISLSVIFAILLICLFMCLFTSLCLWSQAPLPTALSDYSCHLPLQFLFR